VTPGDVLHWHGGRWTIARTWNLDEGPPGPVKWGVTAFSFSPDNVWVFGPAGSGPSDGVWHLHGHAWSRVTGLAHSIFSASAVSASDIWAINAARAGSILHYSGGTWHAVTGPAIAGLRFGGIYASSPTSVWITATVSKTAGLQLLHLQGSRWTAHPMPWTLPVSAVDPDNIPAAALSPDGRGGLWLSGGYSSSRNSNWLLHFSQGGTWSRVAMHGGEVMGLARVHGSTGMWASGSTPQGSGAYPYTDAVVWSYGTR
jgi:hypothetical protein